MKLLDRLLDRAQLAKKVRTLEMRVRDQEAQIRGLNSDILEAKRWSAQVSTQIAGLCTKIDELDFYKHELDARDDDNAALAARLLADNPGIAL